MIATMDGLEEPHVKPSLPGRSGPGAKRTVIRLAWFGLAVASLAGAVELLAGPGYRLGWWGLGSGLQALRWAAIAAAAGGGVALLAALGAAWLRSGRAFGAAAAGIVVGMSGALPPVWFWSESRHLPHIHDVSTDTADLPRYVAVLPLRQGARNPVAYSAATAELQRRGYPDIGPLLLEVAPAQALQRAERVARTMGWEIVAVAPEDGRIEATATTLLFGFKDDVVIRVAPRGSASRVDVRSLSRIGGSDVGTNARRIRAFLAKLKADSGTG
jgi:uncharacterized protein (DUF1499 family)